MAKTHIFLIDPISKLNWQKDSTLFMANTFRIMGQDVRLLFPEDLHICNREELLQDFKCWHFVAQNKENSFALKHFCLTEEDKLRLRFDGSMVLHTRLDPPIDTHYVKILWMLKFLEDRGLHVVNSPRGLLVYNEKILAYSLNSDRNLPTLVTKDVSGFRSFIHYLEGLQYKALILKPLDSYQGRGVEKVSFEDNDMVELENAFLRKVEATKGPIVIQPFYEEVYKGEIRSIFWKEKYLGSLLKVPKTGNYLANIAQGASYHAIDISTKLREECEKILKILSSQGVDLVAFDIMGDRISEVNITCPGLLMETSLVHNKNLTLDILDSFC